jgi:hypothetical protein
MQKKRPTDAIISRGLDSSVKTTIVLKINAGRTVVSSGPTLGIKHKKIEF